MPRVFYFLKNCQGSDTRGESFGEKSLSRGCDRDRLWDHHCEAMCPGKFMHGNRNLFISCFCVRVRARARSPVLALFLSDSAMAANSPLARATAAKGKGKGAGKKGQDRCFVSPSVFSPTRLISCHKLFSLS